MERGDLFVEVYSLAGGHLFQEDVPGNWKVRDPEDALCSKYRVREVLISQGDQLLDSVLSLENVLAPPLGLTAVLNRNFTRLETFELRLTTDD